MAATDAIKQAPGWGEVDMPDSMQGM